MGEKISPHAHMRLLVRRHWDRGDVEADRPLYVMSPDSSRGRSEPRRPDHDRLDCRIQAFHKSSGHYGPEMPAEPDTAGFGALYPDPKPEPDRPENPKELADVLDVASLAFDESDRAWQDACRRVSAIGIATTKELRGEVAGEAEWEPIIDVPTRERLVAVFERRSGGRSRAPRRYLLTGRAGDLRVVWCQAGRPTQSGWATLLCVCQRSRVCGLWTHPDSG